MLNNPILSGGIAGLVEVSLTHPLDYMKVSIQQNKKIVIREFYRGILSRYTSVFPMRGILWGCRKQGKKHLKDSSFLQKSGAIGGVAGFLQTFVDAPLENIKIQRMYYNKVNYQPYYLTRGFVPNMARNMILCSGIIGGSFIDHPFGLLAGSFIGCVASQPFDYIKTIRQSGIKPNYNHIMSGWYYRAMITPINMYIGYHVYKFLTRIE